VEWFKIKLRNTSVKIEGYKELGYSNCEIARILKRAPQMINNAVNQGRQCVR